MERPALELLAELGWTVVDAFGETFGPAGTLGRDSMHDVVLTHRLRDALRWLNPEVPDDIRGGAGAIDEGPLGDGPDAGQPGDPRPPARRLPGRVAGPRRPANRPVPYLDFNDSTKNDWLAASQVWIAGELHRRRADTMLFVNGIPLVLAEFKEPNRPVKAAYDENLTDYRDTIPQLFWPERVRDPVERVGGEGRRDVRAVGVLRRLEGDRRRRHARRRRAGDGDPGHVRPRPAARSGRELRRLHRAAGRAGQDRRPQPPGARRQRGDREPAPDPRRATSGSACSGTRRAPARACRCCGSRRRCCAAPGRLDVRDGHRPHRARRAAPRRVRRRRA